MTGTMPTEADQQRIIDTLRRELAEARAQQTATADVLKVISNAPGELAPVFEAIITNATRLCDAKFGNLFRYDGDAFYFAADVGTPPALADYVRRPGPFKGAPGGIVDRIQATRQVQHLHDYAAEDTPGLAATLGGARSTLGMPILRNDVLVGALVIYRQDVRPFSDREIDLVQSFAAQAGIAIENARLFNETKEALERQTATAEILEVINSSPANLTPVFEAILRNAHALCSVAHGSLQIFEDGHIRAVALHGIAESLADILRRPRPVAEAPTFQVLLQGQRYSQVNDVRGSESPILLRTAQLQGARTLLSVPLRREGKLLGMIVCARREVKPFTDREISLLESFAAQAAIAIRECPSVRRSAGQDA